MAKKIWDFRLEDGRHTVELKHRFASDKREIFVDGKQIESFTKSSDTGSHEFAVSGHTCVLKTEPGYELYVDGKRVLDLFAGAAEVTRVVRKQAKELQKAPVGEPVTSGVPVRLDVEYPERLSRLLLFVKWLLAIPLYIGLAFYGIGAFIVTFAAFWVILVTGRYPEAMFNFVKGYMAWTFKIYAYFPLLLSDHWFPDAPHPLKYEADHPESLSRGVLVFLKLPSFVLNIVQNLIGVATIVLFIVAIPAWWIILFVGKYPRRLFKLEVSLLEWVARVTAWQWLMQDDSLLFGTTQRVRTAVWVGIIGCVIFSLVSFFGI